MSSERQLKCRGRFFFQGDLRRESSPIVRRSPVVLQIRVLENGRMGESSTVWVTMEEKVGLWVNVCLGRKEPLWSISFSVWFLFSSIL